MLGRRRKKARKVKKTLKREAYLAYAPILYFWEKKKILIRKDCLILLSNFWPMSEDVQFLIMHESKNVTS